MDTAWIQVFILTMSECIAPSGKTVCQQQEYRLEFATAEACEVARQQLVGLKSQMDNVIVDQGRTRCAASARQQRVFASLDEVMAEMAPSEGFAAPAESQPAKLVTTAEKQHKDRLASLPTCEDAQGRRPCKIGEIILEESTQQAAEVWRRQN
jgi:hypothetical protein